MRMIKRSPKALQRLSLLLLSSLLLVACGVQRSSKGGLSPAQPTPLGDEPRQTSLTARAAAQRAQLPAQLRGSAQLELKLGKEHFSSRAVVSLVPGKGLYMSIVPFPLIEAARLWLLPEGITAVDRIHGYYAQVSYAELGELLGVPLDYSQLESLLLGQLFLPKASVATSLEGYSYQETAQGASLRAALQLKGKDAYENLWQLDKLGAPTSFELLGRDAAATRLFSFHYTRGGAAVLGLPRETAFTLRGRSTPDCIINWSKLQPYQGTPLDLSVKIKNSYKPLGLRELLKLLPQQ